MSLKKEGYRERLVDKKIEDYLSVAGAVSIEGPKWCGKTWTSLAHANSSINMEDSDTSTRFRLNSELVLNEERPELIDEWIKEPSVWDKVRRKCDSVTTKGNYILSCSTTLSDDAKKHVFHSGAGRIIKLKMDTMSLYESGDSTGDISITDMYNHKKITRKVDMPSLEKIADLIIRGGWPANINVDKNKIGIMPKAYIDSIIDKDIEDIYDVDSNKFLMFMKSLARNEATTAGVSTLIKDIKEVEDTSIDRNTINSYMNILKRLYLLDNQESYSLNYRSPERIGKNSKLHFTDPSLAVALMGLNSDKLIQDLNTFGFLFEALVERDLRIYMSYLNGKVYYLRDNVTGNEVDAVLEFDDGEYALVEIKLGFNSYENAKDNLLKMKDKMKKEPKFMCVICGYSDVITYDEEAEVYTLPITALRP